MSVPTFANCVSALAMASAARTALPGHDVAFGAVASEDVPGVAGPGLAVGPAGLQATTRPSAKTIAIAPVALARLAADRFVF